MAMKIPGIAGSGVPPELPVARTEGPPPEVRRPRREASPTPAPTRERLEESARLLEQTFRLFNKRLKITINDEIDRVVVKVIDGTTDKVIKEIPPEELQRLIARIKETIGLLFDEKI